MIVEKNNINCLFINNIEHKLSQYAVDTECLLAGDRESFERCIAVIDDFGRKSGLYVNAGKTSVFWLGSKRAQQLSICNTSEWNGIRQNLKC